MQNAALYVILINGVRDLKFSGRRQTDEKGMVLEDIINEYMLNMTASAVEVGNGDLLESFIEDERFKKYISELNSDDDSTKNIYDKIVLSHICGDVFGVAQN